MVSFWQRCFFCWHVYTFFRQYCLTLKEQFDQNLTQINKTMFFFLLFFFMRTQVWWRKWTSETYCTECKPPSLKCNIPGVIFETLTGVLYLVSSTSMDCVKWLLVSGFVQGIRIINMIFIIRMYNTTNKERSIPMFYRLHSHLIGYNMRSFLKY